MHTHKKRFGIAAAVMLLMNQAGAQEAGNGGVTGELGAAWDSHYISEGRDNLEEGGLFTTVMEAGASLPVGELGLMSSYGSGYDVDYTEINLGAGWTVPLGDVEVTAGYTYLDFHADDEDDHEVSLDLAYTGWGGVTPFAGGYYSFEAEGTFMEAGVASEYAPHERLVIEPYVLIGFNEGYVANGHDGANHIAVGASVSFALKENLNLGASLSYTAAIDKDEETYEDDASLEDRVYGSVGLTALF
jgi:hypothetical protein